MEKVIPLFSRRKYKGDSFKPFGFKIQGIDKALFAVGVAQLGYVFKARIIVGAVKFQIFISAATAIFFATAAAEVLFFLAEKLANGEQSKCRAEHDGYQ